MVIGIYILIHSLGSYVSCSVPTEKDGEVGNGVLGNFGYQILRGIEITGEKLMELRNLWYALSLAL